MANNDRKLKHNAIGLRRITSRTLRHSAVHPVSTLRQQAVVIADGLRHEYEYTPIKGTGQTLGRQELGQHKHIAERHLKVLSIDSLHTDEPSILLEVNGQEAVPKQNIKMAVFHHMVPTGQEMVHNYFDSLGSIVPQTLSDRESVRVTIGDTLELKNTQGKGVFFSIVGLSVADERAMGELVHCSEVLQERLQILPFIVSWFECREDWLGNEKYNYDMNVERTKKLNILYQLIRHNAGYFESMAARPKANDQTHWFHVVVSNIETGERIEVAPPVHNQTYRRLRRYMERDLGHFLSNSEFSFVLNGGSTSLTWEQENRWRIHRLLEVGNGSRDDPHPIFMKRESRWFELLVSGENSEYIFDMPFKQTVTFKDFREVIERCQNYEDAPGSSHRRCENPLGSRLRRNVKWSFVVDGQLLPFENEDAVCLEGLDNMSAGTFRCPHTISIERRHT